MRQKSGTPKLTADHVVTDIRRRTPNHHSPRKRSGARWGDGTSVTLMNEAGLSIQQVASITGHTLQSATRLLEKYGARTRRLAKAGIVGWENAKDTQFANRLQTEPSNRPSANLNSK